MRNFEHNIQHKASDFSLEPASDSFEKVMAALEKRKKKRMIIWIWWLLIPGIAIGAGMMFPFIFNNSISPSSNPAIAAGKPCSTIHATDSRNQISYIHSIPEELSSTQKKPAMTTLAGHQTTTGLTNISSNHRDVRIQSNTIPTNENSRVNKESEQFIPMELAESTWVNESKIDHPVAERDIISPVAITIPAFQKLQVNSPGIRSTNFTYLNPKLRGVKEKYSRFSLGGYTDLGVMKSLFLENNYPSSADYTNTRKQADQFLFSYSAGLQFRYSPFKFLSFETGIGYSHVRSTQVIASSIGTWTTTGQPDPDTVMTGAFTSPSIDTKEFDNIYGYISIPLKVYYQKKWNWIGIEAGAGVIFDIPVNTYSYEADENNNLSYLRTNVHETRLNRFGIQLSANIHAVFHIKNLSLFAGPTFRYRANSMFDDQYIMKQHYYFVGGETGVRYNF
jgi:hypothetical protein